MKFFKENYLNLLRFIFLTILFLIAATIIYLPSYLRLRGLRRENQRVIAEINKLKNETEVLKRNLNELENDFYLLEKIAREDIGVAKDNEIVIDIKD